jgi:hypothetical protein
MVGRPVWRFAEDNKSSRERLAKIPLIEDASKNSSDEQYVKDFRSLLGVIYLAQNGRLYSFQGDGKNQVKYNENTFLRGYSREYGNFFNPKFIRYLYTYAKLREKKKRLGKGFPPMHKPTVMHMQEYFQKYLALERASRLDRARVGLREIFLPKLEVIHGKDDVVAYIKAALYPIGTYLRDYEFVYKHMDPSSKIKVKTMNVKQRNLNVKIPPPVT